MKTVFPISFQLLEDELRRNQSNLEIGNLSNSIPNSGSENLKICEKVYIPVSEHPSVSQLQYHG